MDLAQFFDNGYAYMSGKLPDAAWALVAGIIAYWLGSKLVRWLTTRALSARYRHGIHKKDLEKRRATLIGLFVSVWRIAVVALMAVGLLRVFFRDIDLAPLFASAGVIGVALGIGAQSLIKDFLSGVFIISENQYRVGDIVEIEAAAGTVERIGLRSTVLRDVEGNVHFLPNGMVQHVINKTLGYSMARFTIAIRPTANIDTVTDIIDTIGKNLAKEEAWKLKIIEAPQFQMVGDITATAINLIVSGKTQPSDQWAVVAEMRRRILDEFDARGIELGSTPLIHTEKSKKK